MMSNDANPLSPLGKKNEDEWIRRHEAEVAKAEAKKRKKKGGDPGKTQPAQEPKK
ncbi:MAG TPA: hypothetical protein V6C81_29285 [Planktothrix sp.]|jgi:hypothetical protein